MSAVLALPGDLITPSQRLVLISLANHANKEGRNSYPARSTVADETGLSERTVSRAVARLRAMGLIGVARYPGRDSDGAYLGSFVYDIYIPGLSTGGKRTPRQGVPTPRQRGGQDVPVTEEPKKRRTNSSPQRLSDLLVAMDLDETG
jgi:hypothetical protein